MKDGLQHTRIKKADFPKQSCAPVSGGSQQRNMNKNLCFDMEENASSPDDNDFEKY